MKVEVGQIWKVKVEKLPMGLWSKVIINKVINTEFSYINLYDKTEFTNISDQYDSFQYCYELTKGNNKINWILYGSINE